MDKNSPAGESIGLLKEIRDQLKHLNGSIQILIDRQIPSREETDQAALLAARAAPDWQKQRFESAEAFEAWNHARWLESLDR